MGTTMTVKQAIAVCGESGAGGGFYVDAQPVIASIARRLSVALGKKEWGLVRKLRNEVAELSKAAKS